MLIPFAASCTITLIIGFSTVLLSLSGDSTISQAGAQVSSTNSSLTYSNPTLGINVQYPSDWTKTEANDGVIFQSPSEAGSDIFREQAGVSVSPSPRNGNISFNEVANQEIDKLRTSFPGFQLIQSISTALTNENNPAQIIVYTFNDNTVGLLKSMKVITPQGPKLYSISYFAQPDKYDRYLPGIQKIIDSFQAINVSPPTSVSPSTSTTPPTPTPTATTPALSPQPLQTDPNIRTFNSSNFGFEIQYPADWTVTEDSQNFLVRFEAPSTDTPEDYYAPDVLVEPNALYRGTVQASMGGLINFYEQEYENFELLDSIPTTIKSGSEAHRITYTYDDSTFGDLKSMEILLKDAEGKFHDITYTAEADEFNQFLPEAQKMIDSFHSTTSTGSGNPSIS